MSADQGITHGCPARRCPYMSQHFNNCGSGCRSMMACHPTSCHSGQPRGCLPSHCTMAHRTCACNCGCTNGGVCSCEPVCNCHTCLCKPTCDDKKDNGKCRCNGCDCNDCECIKGGNCKCPDTCNCGRFIICSTTDKLSILNRETGEVMKFPMSASELIDVANNHGMETLLLLVRDGRNFEAKSGRTKSLSSFSADRAFLVGNYIAYCNDSSTTIIELCNLQENARIVDLQLEKLLHEIRLLDSYYEQLVVGIRSCGEENLIKMYTMGITEIFKAFSETIIAMGLRGLESKYHAAHGTAFQIVCKVVSKWEYTKAIGQELQKLLFTHQHHWDQLIMWLKSIQNIAADSNCTVADWIGSCSSTKLANVLELIAKKCVISGELKKLVQIAQSILEAENDQGIQIRQIAELTSGIMEVRLVGKKFVMKTEKDILIYDSDHKREARFYMPQSCIIVDADKVFLEQDRRIQNFVTGECVVLPDEGRNSGLDYSIDRKAFLFVDENRRKLSIYSV